MARVERVLLASIAGFAVLALVLPASVLEAWGADDPVAREALRWCGVFLLAASAAAHLADRWGVRGRRRWLLAVAPVAAAWVGTRNLVVLFALLVVAFGAAVSLGTLVGQEYYERFVDALRRRRYRAGEGEGRQASPSRRSRRSPGSGWES